MPKEEVGSRAGDQAGSTFQRAEVDFGKFKESLGEVGKDKALEPIKDFGGLAKSFVDAQKMIGGSIRLPKKDAKPEDRTKAIGELMTRLRAEGVVEGIPEAPDKYEIKFPMEDFEPNKVLVDSFRAAAHKIGLPQSQVQGVFDWYINFQAEAERQEQEEFETLKSGLKKEYGGLFVRKMEAARRGLTKYFGEDGDAVVSSLPPKVGVRVLKAFAEVGEPLLEEEMISGEIPGVTTLEEMKKKIDVIVADAKHPLWTLDNPGHKAAVEEWTKLQRDYNKLLDSKGRGK